MNRQPNHIFLPLSQPDALGFDWLFRNYYSRLCLFSFKLVHDRHSAQDIVQDCFFQLWKRRANLNWSENITAYLYSMVRYSSYHHLRDQPTILEITPETPANCEEQILALLIEVETMHEVYSAIDALPPKTAAIMRSLYIDGKDVKQVSSEQQITESTLRSHKSNALKLIRQLVNFGIIVISWLL